MILVVYITHLEGIIGKVIGTVLRELVRREEEIVYE